MAYPFAPMPTLGDFVGHALANGCEAFDFQRELIGPRGAVKVRCLKGRRNVIVVLPDVADDEPLTPTVLRSLCNRLGLDPKHFGLTQG